MSLSSEDEVKKALDIASWRNLSRDKFLAFVEAMPNVDKEVALKIVAQFPDFKELVKGTFESLERSYDTAVKGNWKSQKRVHGAYSDYRVQLDRELEREDLTPEQRLVVLGMFRDAVMGESAKDSEQKSFMVKLATIGATVGLVVAGVAVVALGGKAGLGRKDDSA